MTAPVAARPLAWLQLATLPLAALAVLFGASALAGWSLGSEWLKRIHPGGVPMNPLTAVLFIVAGAGLGCQGRLPGDRRLLAPGLAHWCTRCAGIAVLIVGGVKIAEYLLELNLAFDHLMFAADVGTNQVAPNTALGMVLIGAAFLLVDVEGPRGGRPDQGFALACIMLAVFALLGYFYGISSLYGVSTLLPMALNTALAFLMVGAGILAANPGRGLMRSFSSPGPGGELMRRLLPAAVVVPALLGWLWLELQRADVLPMVAATGLLAASNMLLFAAGIIVTARMLDRADARRRAAEEQQRLLLESAGEGIYGIDNSGNCTFINPAGAAMIGYRPEEARGQNMHALIHARRPDGSPYPVEDCPIYQAFRTGESQRIENEVFWRKDGTSFPVTYSSYPIRGAGGAIHGAVITFTDITERERLRAMLVQSEKLASIGLLSAGIAHEINNPLAFVANNLAVLHRDFKGLMGILDAYEAARNVIAAADPLEASHIETLSEELDLAYVRDNLERVVTRTREGVQRVTNIVQGLRSLARTDRPQLEDVYLPELVEMALELIRERLRRRGIAIEQDYGPKLKLRCVPTQLGQVLLNLLTNAMQAIEASKHGPGGRIRITAHRVGPDVVIEVEDNGGGIDPKNLPHIFDPFFTTKPVGEGTGLGLAITHGIVTGHGGRIEVQSQPGQGTCFRILFPAVPAHGK
jgi:PAS domain S-box-containing protein